MQTTCVDQRHTAGVKWNNRSSCRWLVRSASGPWSCSLNASRWRTGLVECASTKPARHRSQCKRGTSVPVRWAGTAACRTEMVNSGVFRTNFWLWILFYSVTRLFMYSCIMYKYDSSSIVCCEQHCAMCMTMCGFLCTWWCVCETLIKISVFNCFTCILVF